MTRPAYTELYFGKSDSRNELNTNAEVFVRSFVDHRHLVEQIVSGERFLLLGPKGTGKSAVAWYLTATEVNGNHLALVRDASQLPLAEVPRVQTGQPAGTERTVSAWKFVLLCNYLELLLRDQGCSLQSKRDVTRVAKILRDYGFMGDASGKALLKASTTTVSLPIPQLGQITSERIRPL